jgi:hypothetical protein
MAPSLPWVLYSRDRAPQYKTEASKAKGSFTMGIPVERKTSLCKHLVRHHNQELSTMTGRPKSLLLPTNQVLASAEDEEGSWLGVIPWRSARMQGGVRLNHGARFKYHLSATHVAHKELAGRLVMANVLCAENLAEAVVTMPSGCT